MFAWQRHQAKKKLGQISVREPQNNAVIFLQKPSPTLFVIRLQPNLRRKGVWLDWESPTVCVLRAQSERLCICFFCGRVFLGEGHDLNIFWDSRSCCFKVKLPHLGASENRCREACGTKSLSREVIWFVAMGCLCSVPAEKAGGGQSIEPKRRGGVSTPSSAGKIEWYGTG